MEVLTSDHCRLCLNLCPESTTSVTSIKTLYEQLTGYIIDENLDTPKLVCTACVQLMRHAETFQMQCSDTEAVLDEYRAGMKEEQVDNYENIETLDAEKEVKAETLIPETDELVSILATLENDGIIEEEEGEEIENLIAEPEEEEIVSLIAEPEAVEKFDKVEEEFLVKYFQPDLLDFKSLKDQCSDTPTECELFVLSYENPQNPDLPASVEVNQDTDLSNRRQTACTYCPFISFSINGVKDHLVTRHPKAHYFKCPFCQLHETFCLDRMRRHCMRKHSDKSLPPLTSLSCDHCTFECSHQVTMEMHCEKYHLDAALLCECGATFGCRDLKLQHILFQCSVATSNCLLPYENILDFGSPVSEITEPKKTAMCETCGKMIKKVHMHIHKRNCNNKEERFYCDLCKCSYKVKIELVRHMKRLHLNQLTYPCDQCDRVFVSWHTRYCHVNSIHANIRYDCDICGKVFRGKQQRNAHRVQHPDITDYRIYQCDQCDRNFKVPERLSRHKRMVHVTGRPFICSVCHKSFKNTKALKQHMSTHKMKEYMCPICNTSYAVSYSLRSHMKSAHPHFPMPPQGTALKNVDLRTFLEDDTEQ